MRARERPMSDPLIIAGREFSSRLLLGTGKFPSNASLAAAIAASGAEIVTVALRRVDPTATEDILDAIDTDRVLLLTNTSGAVDAEEAVRLARLARSAGLPPWIKLEVTPDPRYLLPDGVETLKAAETLCAEGFTILPYVNADPVLCKRLEEAGCATVMPLGSWIGSNQGLRTRAALEIIIDPAMVPAQVERALARPPAQRDLADFAALISPAAAPFLEQLAAQAHDLTIRRFGRTVHLFAPLYLSNECVSVCTYCGFSAGNEIARRTLTIDEVVDEGRELVHRGFRRLL